MTFLVIINPNDGPGNDTLSDPNFQRELPKLFNRQNVVPIGYVQTANATRSIKDVENDVDKYSKWVLNSTSNYLMHGIFFDETPSIYTSEGAAFMSQIDDYVKHHNGFSQSLVYASLDLLTQIVHNPGTIPDDRLFVGADIIVVCETGYYNYTSDSSFQASLKQLPTQDIASHSSAGSYSYIFNGVPSNWTINQLRGFIDNVKGGAQWLFMTDISMDNSENIYGEWGSDWDAFIQAMASSQHGNS